MSKPSEAQLQRAREVLVKVAECNSGVDARDLIAQALSDKQDQLRAENERLRAVADAARECSYQVKAQVHSPPVEVDILDDALQAYDAWKRGKA